MFRKIFLILSLISVDLFAMERKPSSGKEEEEEPYYAEATKGEPMEIVQKGKRKAEELESERPEKKREIGEISPLEALPVETIAKIHDYVVNLGDRSPKYIIESLKNLLRLAGISPTLRPIIIQEYKRLLNVELTKDDIKNLNIYIFDKVAKKRELVVGSQNIPDALKKEINDLPLLINLLIKINKFDNSIRDNKGKNLLMLATEADLPEVVDMLLRNKVFNINEKDSRGYSALALVRNERIAKMLLGSGADINSKSNLGYSTILSIVNLYVDAPLNSRDPELLKTIKFLASKGANVNAKNKNGQTPLMVAAFSNDADLVQLLLEFGANVNEKNKYGDTALMFAIEEGSSDIVTKLIDIGADVNIKNKSWTTPLGLAAKKDRADVVKMLLDKGANVNVQSKSWYTPLMWASKNGNIDIVRLLVGKNANLNLMNKYGKTAHILAQEAHHRGIAELLKDAAEIDRLLQSEVSPEIAEQAAKELKEAGYIE
ncbi:ankyrin repeat domain-containing protein [Candidatus Dependentiae bacterium]|nr:ankyrin repeat domain-containing protein [Candidatus Dependentiae bacterium]